MVFMKYRWLKVIKMMHFHTTSKICLDYLYSILILDLGQTLSFGFRLCADHTTKDQHISSTNFFYESKGKLLHNYIFRPNIFSSGVRAGVCQCYRPQHHLPVCGISNSLSRDICHVFLLTKETELQSYSNDPRHVLISSSGLVLTEVVSFSSWYTTKS